MILWKISYTLKVVMMAALLCAILCVACSPNLEDGSNQAPGDLGSGADTTPDAGRVDRTDLDACIAEAILKDNTGKYGNGDFATEAYTVFKTVESGDTVTVYLMALYMEFNFASHGLEEAGGSHGPVAITFQRDAAGEYELVDYWRARDGTGYAPSIEARFPTEVYEDALDTQKYILGHTQACYEKAVEYGNVDACAVIGKLLETICSSPAESSSPQAYIDEHHREYRKLLYYGDYTLRYVFSEFLEGGQTGLEGHVMLAVMRELIAGEDVSLEAETPQEWFDDWRDRAVRTLDANSMEYMAEHAPKAYILLQMLDLPS